ncbi:hypothetical protein Pcinc_023245 [Petrolisthes cinctipes]|uniref:Uncharacterized protein n=1 Tax=Petrolisthes cinctipes TaxID=88211 RepID=A0AAE1FG21_PETCI|nr:hypothetical protein Pcinc_023245 [Petrolisthes cinctipes]
MWRDIKNYVTRCGIRTKYLNQYLARYLFIKTYKEESLHYFLLQAAKLYPPQGDQPPQPHPLSEDEFSDGFSGFSDDDYPDDPQPGPSQR